MKLSFKDKIAYSSAGIGDGAAYSVVGTFLMFFLTTVGHVSPVLAGTIIALGSIWDVIWSLVIGFWSDNSGSRMGRRRPFLLIGAVMIAVSCSLLFNAIDAGPVFKAIYYGTIILVFWIGFSTFFVPYLALGAEYTDDYTERTKLRSVTYGFNILGTLIGVVLPLTLVDLLSSCGFDTEGSWFMTGAFVGIVSAVSICITVALSKDKDKACRREEEKKRAVIESLADMVKGYAGVLKLKPIRYLLAASIFYLIASTIYGADRLYFYTYNLKFDTASSSAVLLFTSIVGLLFAPVIMALTRWLDKRSLLIACMLVSAVLVAVAKFTGITTIAGMLLFIFVFYIGSSAYWQLMPAMIYDICEYDELETGKRREGSIVSLLSVSEALSQAIAMQLLGIILQLAGFDGSSASQTGAALEWVENSLIVIPAVFMVLTVFMVFLYPITKKKFEEIQVELRKRSDFSKEGD
jgi:glycoside/pentoside/hexuronide:cation symporter, GPH family